MAIRWALVPILLPAVLAVACDSGATKPPPTPTATIAASSAPFSPRAVEADADPSLPGDYVNLPAIYGGYYGNRYGPNTGAHRLGAIDYSAQGLPPAGGPHWGSSRCPPDPTRAPPNCGPVPWGMYRQPWHAESLVHNMEHGGVVIWYNTSDQHTIDELEKFATEQLRAGKMLVLVPYLDMASGRIAITVWSRRDEFAVSNYDPKRLQHFIDVLYCRFDPERLCHRGGGGGLTVTASGRYHLKAL